MSDLSSGLTCVGGVTVLAAFVLKKFLFEPARELLKLIQDVRSKLSFHATTIHTAIGRTKETSDAAETALKESSSELEAKLHGMSLYGVSRIMTFCRLPCRKDVEQAAILLRGLSTYMHQTGDKAAASVDDVSSRVEKIEKLLKLKSI